MEQQNKFDEMRALAELEQLLQAIEAARRQRVQASDRLEAFVREVRTRDRQPIDRSHTFDPPTDVPLPADKNTAAVEPPLPVRSVEAETASSTTDGPPGLVPADGPVPVPIGSPASDACETAAGAIGEPAAGASSPHRARTLLTSRRVLTTAGVVLALVFAIVAGLRLRDRAPQPVSETPAGSPVPPAAVEAAPKPPPPAAALEGELTAVRRVWVRVTADGSRVVERELDAGTRVPLRASRALVLRIGDAGAVHLTINGREQSLGGDGQVITKTYLAER